MHSRKRLQNGCTCNQADYIKLGTYCPHWEKQLPGVEGPQAKKIVFTSEPERFQTAETPEEEYLRLEEASKEPKPEERLVDDETALLEKLIRKGLAEKKARVVVDRLCNGKTFNEIAKDLGYRHARAAHTAYEDAIKWLKKHGGNIDEWS